MNDDLILAAEFIEVFAGLSEHEDHLEALAARLRALAAGMGEPAKIADEMAHELRSWTGGVAASTVAGWMTRLNTAPQAAAPRAEAVVERDVAGNIEIADYVHHKPTGEDWVVARVDGDHLYPAGWPESRALLSDCKLIRKASAEKRAAMIADLRKLPASDSRQYRDAPPAEQGRDGWKLVPVEPTEAMLDEHDFYLSKPFRGRTDIWHAMLSAAPIPPDAGE